MVDELKNLHKKKVKLFAIDGQRDPEIGLVYDKEKSIKIMRRPLTLGEIGCAYGHLLAYQNSLDTDWLIVLEDDATFNHQIDQIESILSNLGTKPCVVHLDDIDARYHLSNFYSYKGPTRPYRTHAYAINSQALKVAVKLQQSIISTADWPIQWRYSVNFCSLKNDVYGLANGDSLIERERLPLQLVAIQHFQEFRSSSRLRRALNNQPKAKKIIAAIYIYKRFFVYVRVLNTTYPSKIRSALYSSINELL